MVSINVGNGQGITQAIASQLGLSRSDCKSVELAKWQQVVKLVDENNNQRKQAGKESVFTGGNNINNIGQKENWKTDFKLTAGQSIELDDSVWTKIKQILNAEKTEVVSQTSTQNTEETKKGKEFEDFSIKNKNNNEASFDVLDDSWRQLVNKQNKTQAEQEQISAQYKAGFLKFGDSYMNHIDQTYGNGDGVLTEDEYVQSETNGLPKEYVDNLGSEQISKYAKNTFKHIDLNNDQKIDSKEMAALMSMFDQDVRDKGKINGRLKTYDITASSLNLIKNDNEEGGKAIVERLKTMYEFLFGKK